MSDNNFPYTSNRCESWWDGIYQWPEAAANTTISIPCHKIFALTMGNVNADDYERQTLYARRTCLASGQWGWNNWTNYTECLNLLAMQEKDTSMTNRIQEIVSYIVLILLIASMVSLIISIVIFISFKPLKCLRIKVHKNLCVALLMNCCLYIIMNSLAGIHKLDLSSIADWFCKSLKALNIYSSMATINWMFVEGFLFHKTLSSPFHQNTRLYLAGYYFIGWIFPAICVITWSLSVEFLSNVSEKLCWEGYRVSNTIFIVSVPMIICVGINFLFLINIIRILLTKLKADNKSDSATIKAIKATALLIPLLGIHHLVVLYNPSTFNRKLVNIYIIINVMFQSVQGIIVSVLYCFTNQEVRTVLNSAWSRRRMSLNPMSGNNSNINNKRRRQTIALYLLGARYVVKEIRRKLSSKVRKLSSNEPDIPNVLTNYIAVVTGGSRGIGLSVAKDLYRRGCVVIVTSSASTQAERDKVAEEARDSTHPTVPGGNIVVWPIDFRDMSSVYDFTTRFNKEYKYLDILINNAGVMFVDKNYTNDGFEYHYQINYLSHVLLTWLLMPALNRANKRGPARVVNVSSSTHYPRCLFIEDLQSKNSPYSPFHAYAQSKLCQIMFTYYMADLLKRMNNQYRVIINSLHPGVAMTGLYQYVWWVKLFPWLASFLFRTADEGAETVIYVALSTQIESSGYYYEDCAQLKSSKFSLDKTMQTRLANLTREQLENFIDRYNRIYPEYQVPKLLAY